MVAFWPTLALFTFIYFSLCIDELTEFQEMSPSGPEQGNKGKRVGTENPKQSIKLCLTVINFYTLIKKKKMIYAFSLF